MIGARGFLNQACLRGQVSASRRIWIFFAVVLADLVLPLFFMEMVISQNVDSVVNYLSILPFPCLIVI